MSKVRKALVAAGGAGVAAAAAYLASAGKVDGSTLGQAGVAFLVAAIPVGWATWATPNTPA